MGPYLRILLCIYIKFLISAFSLFDSIIIICHMVAGSIQKIRDHLVAPILRVTVLCILDCTSGFYSFVPPMLRVTGFCILDRTSYKS